MAQPDGEYIMILRNQYDDITTKTVVLYRWVTGLHQNKPQCNVCFIIKVVYVRHRCLIYLVPFGRTTKLPAVSEGKQVALIYKGDHSSTNVAGFAPLAQSVTVFDGKSDLFDSCPSMIRKRFTSTQSIREFMGITENCKVFALVMEDFVSKGHHKYEVNITKALRSGYGKGSVKWIKPTSNTDANAVASFFGKTHVSTGHGAPSAAVPSTATETKVPVVSLLPTL